MSESTHQCDKRILDTKAKETQVIERLRRQISAHLFTEMVNEIRSIHARHGVFGEVADVMKYYGVENDWYVQGALNNFVRGRRYVKLVVDDVEYSTDIGDFSQKLPNCGWEEIPEFAPQDELMAKLYIALSELDLS